MRYISVILTLLLSVITASAMDVDLHFHHYKVGAGLPSNCIRDITQDNRGFMWFATDGGLVRFDGITFKLYPLEAPDSSYQEENYIRSVHASENELWAGTDVALYRYDEANDRFVNYRLTTASGKQVCAPIIAITSDRNNRLWLSIVGFGVFELDRIKNTVTHYEFPQCMNFIGNLFIDRNNVIWAQSNQGTSSLFEFDKASNSFRPFTVTVDGKPVSTPSYTMIQDPDNNMLLGTWDGYIIKFDPYSGQGVYMKSEQCQLQHIHSMTMLSGSQFFVGSDAGLTWFDLESGRNYTYRQDELDPNSLSDRFIYPIYRDREGGTWIGTFYGGLNYLSPDLKKFDKYRHSRYRNSVSGNLISGLCEDSSGNVWIVSDDGGLTRYTPSTNTFTHVPVNFGDGKEMLNLHALCMDDDILWIGSYAMGVAAYNIRTSQIRHYEQDPYDRHSLDGNSSYAIFRDRDNVVWVSTLNGINRWNRETDDFTRVRNLGATTVDIDQDSRGKLWFCTHGKGLFSFQPSTGVWKNYRYSDKEGSINHNHVNCMTIDSRGTTWVGTAKGLCRFLPEEDTFEECDEIPSGLNVSSIVEDQGILWLGTDKGLFRYIPGHEYLTYTIEDGLPANQFMCNTRLKTSSGKIFLGTTSGLCAFFPYQIRPNTYEAPVVFTGIDIDNHPVDVGEKHLPKELNLIDELHLYHNDYSLSVHFATLSYDTPGKNTYSYKLDGLDKEWIDAGTDNKVTYTNLAPGNYTLRVKGTNKDKVTGREALLKIKVFPPWYGSLPMKMLYVLLIVATVLIIYRYMLRRSEKAHQTEIERINSTRERDVFQAKLNFFTMIAHEIRTPVSLIIAPLEKIMRTKEAMTPPLREDLNIIQRNSQRLLCLVNQLLDFKKVEQDGITMKFRPTDINSLLLSIAERFWPSIEQKGGRLICDLPEEALSADVDPEALTKLVSNLLNNARKFMSDEIRLSLSVDKPKTCFSISVTDNGIGISPENREKIFAPFFQVSDGEYSANEGTGLGLSIVRRVVKAHKGTIDVDSEVGKFTTFTATLPIHQDEIYTEEEEPESTSEIAETGTGEEKSARKTLLIVDDNEEMLSFIATNFKNDFDVVTAVDGVDALGEIKKRDIDFIICDWMMPRMDGLELCRILRNDKNFSHIPFILLTAKTDNYSKIEGMKGGADIYVEKPFSVEYLKACINNICEMRERLRRKYNDGPLEPLTTVAQTPVDNDFLVQLGEIIESNFSNAELSVDFLANKIGISRSSLYSKIKSLTNMTPNELIQVTRLKRAAVLLAEGKYRVSEIGYMVGFNSSSYFSKCFKMQFGIKPGEFVEQKDTKKG